MEGDKVTSIPDPASPTACGLPGASSAKASVDLRGPGTFGEEVALTVQLDPAASVLGESGHPLV